ncbi:hypothetical protein [Erythrobacter sp. WG]|uniref:hypothetical protein n=1 Tax=Erythrobacter sp. WG TaxID=2985510 RepID=UPI00226E4B70|nr:hypothetical protein [Erythrobacter sp. WG]MCX9148654.1 hypothetical protein [Erythrobacter sp. WG]
MNRAPLAALCLALALAGCEQQAAPAEEGAGASGEVLAGSVSDAMIPLGELTSEAPLAPRQGPADTAPGLEGEQPEAEPVPGIDEAAVADEAAAAPAPDQPPQ